MDQSMDVEVGKKHGNNQRRPEEKIFSLSKQPSKF